MHLCLQLPVTANTVMTQNHPATPGSLVLLLTAPPSLLPIPKLWQPLTCSLSPEFCYFSGFTNRAILVVEPFAIIFLHSE